MLSPTLDTRNQSFLFGFCLFFFTLNLNHLSEWFTEEVYSTTNNQQVARGGMHIIHTEVQVLVFFLQMHLQYIEEEKVSTESNSPVVPDNTASPPAPSAGQTASGKDRGKKKRKSQSNGRIADATKKSSDIKSNSQLWFGRKVQPEVWNAQT